MGFCMVYITHADQAAAESLVHQLLSEKLIACGNIFPIKSAYWWQGQIENDDEVLSIIKTPLTHWEALKSRVETLHPYDIPCIIKIEVEANDNYEKWIHNSVKKL